MENRPSLRESQRKPRFGGHRGKHSTCLNQPLSPPLVSDAFLRGLGGLNISAGFEPKARGTSANPRNSTRCLALGRVAHHHPFRVRRAAPLNSRAQRATWLGVVRRPHPREPRESDLVTISKQGNISRGDAGSAEERQGGTLRPCFPCLSSSPRTPRLRVKKCLGFQTRDQPRDVSNG